MESNYPNTDELMEFLRNAVFSSSIEIAVPHEPAPNWGENITTFEEHLNEHYGPIGSPTRDEYEQGRLEFFKTIETNGDLEFVIPENLD
jgi:hypothetical protein